MASISIYAAGDPYAVDCTVQSRNGATHSLLGRVPHTVLEDRLKQLVRASLDTWLKEVNAMEAAAKAEQTPAAPA